MKAKELKIKKKPMGLDDKVINTIVTAISALVLILTLYPLIFVVSASISDPDIVNAGKLYLLPKGFTLDGYELIFENRNIWIGYRNTIFYSIFGTFLNMLVTIPCAYSLSRKDLKGRNLIMMFFTFTMFFGGGMIPTYLAIKSYGMLNTIWAVLFPGLVGMGNLIIARTYFAASIPWELQEAAIVDGASNTRMLVSIILPLSAPILGVLTLYYLVGHWNSYFNALLYITKEDMFPLQLFLRNILLLNSSTDLMAADPDALEDMIYRMRLKTSMQYGLVVVSTLPILIIYPFLQKYFVKGVMMGAIKG